MRLKHVVGDGDIAGASREELRAEDGGVEGEIRVSGAAGEGTIGGRRASRGRTPVAEI